MSEYEVMAFDFLKKAETKMTISRIGEVRGFPVGHDDLWHYKYQVTFTRKGKQCRTTFYDSFENWRMNKRPSRYSILACLEKYDPGTFDDFIFEFGYSREDIRQVKKIYEACKKQYEKLADLFGDDLMKDLREIW